MTDEAHERVVEAVARALCFVDWRSEADSSDAFAVHRDYWDGAARAAIAAYEKAMRE